MQNGDCYPNAYNLLMQLHDEGNNKALLVHGIFTRKNGNIENHAWVEIGDLMIDPSIDPENPFQFIKKEFYKSGGVSENKVRRYTYMEALEKLISTGNYGPWH